MGDKEVKKTGWTNRFLLWLAKSILFGAIGVILLGIIVYALQKLNAPLTDLLINTAGLSPSVSAKILVVLAAAFWILLIGNIIMYFRGIKR